MTTPNIILILADDLGFSDIGCFGSEIRTPNIDRMAANGAAVSSMYNCARCCPTRASLLTGLYPHKAGIGHMGANLGAPAYQGYLRNDAATIAECLRPAGYKTLMSGKWHVGGDYHPHDAANWRVGDATHPTPRQRGFDEFYGMIDGAGSFFSPHHVMRNDTRIEVTDDSFHFTDTITDAACDMIQRVGDPFFLYLAYTAPHWPLHAHAEDIARYDGVYDKGWDAIRTARHEELNGRRLLRQPWDISPRDPDAPPFDGVANKGWEAARMATYAAMVEQMDRGIGKVIDMLEAKGELDNTLILFLSDNGGCAELMEEDGWARFYPLTNHDGSTVQPGNRPDLAPGARETFMSYDLPWANVSNAPFRSFKHWVHEGGVSTPLIAHWPDRIKGPVKAHEPCHVVDILPTILAAAGAPHLSEVNDEAAQPTDGEDLTRLLTSADWTREQPIYWEHEGNAAIRAAEWKLVRRHGAPWELYQMDEDRTELHDLASGEQSRVDAHSRDYQAWADSIGVQDWTPLSAELRRQWGMEGDR